MPRLTVASSNNTNNSKNEGIINCLIWCAENEATVWFHKLQSPISESHIVFIRLLGGMYVRCPYSSDEMAAAAFQESVNHLSLQAALPIGIPVNSKNVATQAKENICQALEVASRQRLTLNFIYHIPFHYSIAVEKFDAGITHRHRALVGKDELLDQLCSLIMEFNNQPPPDTLRLLVERSWPTNLAPTEGCSIEGMPEFNNGTDAIYTNGKWQWQQKD